MKILSKQRIILNNRIFLLVIFSMFIILALVPYSLAQDYTNISVETAYNMINDDESYPNLVILDVRTPEEYNANHLYDSINIELDALEGRLEELSVHRNHKIIVYCNSGYRSQQASEILSSNEFTKIFNMLGGIQSWIAVDYDLWVAADEGSDILSIPFDLATLILVSIGSIILLGVIAKNKFRFIKQ